MSHTNNNYEHKNNFRMSMVVGCRFVQQLISHAGLMYIRSHFCWSSMYTAPANRSVYRLMVYYALQEIIYGRLIATERYINREWPCYFLSKYRYQTSMKGLGRLYRPVDKSVCFQLLL